MHPSVDFHALLTQLQSRYPFSSLVTELLPSQGGQCVVRAMIQVGGMAIASGMAAASTVEQAEDHARLRALALVGIVPTLATPTLAPVPPVAPPAPTPIPTPPSPPAAPVAMPAIATPLPPNGFVPVPPPPAWLDPTPSAPPAIAESPTVAPTRTSEGTSPEIPGAAEAEEPMGGVPLSEDAIEDRYPPDEESFSDDWVNEQEDLPPVMAAPVPPPPVQTTERDRPSSSRPSKSPKGSKAKPITEAPAPPPEPEPAASLAEPDDLSNLIAMTDIEMDRIGWTKQQGRDYLKETYKKSTRQRLDVNELMDFLNYLRALPSAHGLL